MVGHTADETDDKKMLELPCHSVPIDIPSKLGGLGRRFSVDSGLGTYTAGAGLNDTIESGSGTASPCPSIASPSPSLTMPRAPPPSMYNAILDSETGLALLKGSAEKPHASSLPVGEGVPPSDKDRDLHIAAGRELRGIADGFVLSQDSGRNSPRFRGRSNSLFSRVRLF